jgi:hypothetical protein
MAEAQEAEEKPAVPIEEPPSQPAPIEDPADDERPPGGSEDLSVYGRKMNARAKKAEQEARLLREENIRLAQKAKDAEEAKSKPPDEIYNRQQVLAFVREGKLDRAVADDYIKAIVEPMEIKALYEAAQAEIAEFVSLIPALGDSSSEAYRKAAAEYADLMSRGLPDNHITRALAISNAHGKLSIVKERARVREMNSNPRTMPVDGSGGSNNGGSAPKDMSHAPAHLQEYWQKAGLNEKERAQHFKTWQSRQPKK